MFLDGYPRGVALYHLLFARVCDLIGALAQS